MGDIVGHLYYSGSNGSGHLWMTFFLNDDGSRTKTVYDDNEEVIEITKQWPDYNDETIYEK